MYSVFPSFYCCPTLLTNSLLVKAYKKSYNAFLVGLSTPVYGYFATQKLIGVESESSLFSLTAETTVAIYRKLLPGPFYQPIEIVVVKFRDDVA